MSITKLLSIFLLCIYAVYQLGFLSDSPRIYKNIMSFHDNELIGFVHAILYLTLTPGLLIAGSIILIIFSNQFNQIDWMGRWFIVGALFVLFFVNIIASYILGGAFYFWLPWQILLALLLISLLKGFNLI